MNTIEISSKKRNQFIDIDSKVQQLVHDSGVEEGTCLVYCPHTTAGITINEGADPAVRADLLRALDEIVPNIDYQHMEGNSDAHLKSSLIGASEVIPIKNRKLKLGRWQKIYFCEFDGPRTRKVWIKINER